MTAKHWPSTNSSLVVRCMVGNLPDRASGHIISRQRTRVCSKLTVPEYPGHASIGTLSCVTDCRFAYCRDDPSRSTACWRTESLLDVLRVSRARIGQGVG